MSEHASDIHAFLRHSSNNRVYWWKVWQLLHGSIHTTYTVKCTQEYHSQQLACFRVPIAVFFLVRTKIWYFKQKGHNWKPQCCKVITEIPSAVRSCHNFWDKNFSAFIISISLPTGWFRCIFHVRSLLWYVKLVLLGRKNAGKVIRVRRNPNSKSPQIFSYDLTVLGSSIITLQHLFFFFCFFFTNFLHGGIKLMCVWLKRNSTRIRNGISNKQMRCRDFRFNGFTARWRCAYGEPDRRE